MTSSQAMLQKGLLQIDQDLEFVMGCFQEMLADLGEEQLAKLVPWTGHPKRGHKLATKKLPERIEQVYAIAFQLLNLIEESVSAHVRQEREKRFGLAGEPGLWGANLKALKQCKVSAKKIAEGLSQMRVEPVLTAHPTEAKRAAVLEQHRQIFALLQARYHETKTPAEQEDLREELKLVLERLWRAGEILLHKPEVAAERRNLLYYFQEVFPDMLTWLDKRLLQAWVDAGLDGEPLFPNVRFGSWVGGDRDGHPLVTAEVTRETLNELRAHALLLMETQLTDLSHKLCLSQLFQPPPAAFSARIHRLVKEVGDVGTAIQKEVIDEPWKLFVRLLIARLPLEDRSHGKTYQRSQELIEDLDVLANQLKEVGADRLMERDVMPVRRVVETFGFHLASLDVRQNSQFHDQAVGELLVAAGMPKRDACFAEWNEEKRLEWLKRELASPRPLTQSNVRAGVHADQVLDCFRLLAEHKSQYGSGGLGVLIVSMARQLSDLLVVYLLAKEAGLARFKKGELYCDLPVVPLFETVEDLQRAPKIMDAFLGHSVTRRCLNQNAEPVQQIMIGYSDSNKESGILASQWALRQAQTMLVHVAKKHDVRIRFFHGRGGTVSRGAGPTHRFLEALPEGTIQGDLRVTEQGETIAQKYANRETARFHLETLVACVAGVSMRPKARPKKRESKAHLQFQAIMDDLVSTSRQAYLKLIHADGFVDFFRQTTPIDALEHSQIGSRPTRRMGQTQSIADLRAIPWVFGWNQARYYLPGWYGVGSALEKLQHTSPEQFEIFKDALRDYRNEADWAFIRYVLMNVELNLASADVKIMRGYAQLVHDPKLRSRFLNLIIAEFERTQNCLHQLFGESILSRRPRASKTLALRADALRELHYEQIHLLQKWRNQLARKNKKGANDVMPKLLLSINAIASGLRTTG